MATGAILGPGTTLTSCEVGEGAEVIHTWAELAVIGAEAHVGPFTYLRPGTVLGDGAKAGAYVEIKNSTVGRNAKVPHLSYVGDADIGEGSNIGAATVFVNYDGVAKHRTVVGSHVRIGSDTMLVAPVRPAPSSPKTCRRVPWLSDGRSSATSRIGCNAGAVERPPRMLQPERTTSSSMEQTQPLRLSSRGSRTRRTGDVSGSAHA